MHSNTLHAISLEQIKNIAPFCLIDLPREDVFSLIILRFKSSVVLWLLFRRHSLCYFFLQTDAFKLADILSNYFARLYQAYAFILQFGLPFIFGRIK
jgi:hypothetical protein